MAFPRPRFTGLALALMLVAVFIGLAAADRAERNAAAAREHRAAIERIAASVETTLDQDGRLLDRLAAEPPVPSPPGDLILAPALVRGIRAAALTDRRGAVLARAPSGTGGAPFEALVAEAKAALVNAPTSALYLSHAVPDPALGVDLVGVARARRDANGVFVGLALIAVDAASLVPPELLPAHGTVELRRNDRAVLFCTGRGAGEGLEAAVDNYPLSVTYRGGTSEIGREWRAVWLRNGALVGGVGILVTLFAGLIDRRRRRAAARVTESQAQEAIALRRNVAELAAAANRVDEASRAKSRFFAQITHELRTPLNAILGFSETIRREMFGPVANPRYLEYAGLIHDAGQHLLSLINDLLDISKLEEDRMQIAPIRVSAAALARSTLDLVELLARERNITLALSGIETCPDLHADPRAAKQVLVNLLSNAIKFTEPGGHIDLGFAARADRSVAVTVTDTGVGMSSEEVKIAFEPFGRAVSASAAAVPGTGLGLPIARALVRLHGGELTLASVPGRGTTVTAVFPAEAALRPVESLAPARAA
ncbi:MAG: ATP-binding protein [Stellaceae bacterium]